MKLFKKLAILCTALTLCCGVSVALTACEGDEPSSGISATQETVYKFKVLNKDGTAATQYKVQLCKKDENGKLGACLSVLGVVGADGVATISVADTSTKYEIHLISVESGDLLDKFSYNTQDTPVGHDGSEIVVRLTK